MSDDQKLSISEKIEDAVEGVLRFFTRLFITTWTIFRHPLSCGPILLAADPTERRFVLPLTYLTLGGFIFTLVISVYPFGLLNILDTIWFDQDISKNLYERWSEALSITGLLTATFPVFLSVTLFAALVSRLFHAGELRAQFRTLTYYAFGYQTLLFFFMFFVFIGLDLIGSAIVGPYHPPQINESLSDFLTNAILIALVLIFLSPLLMPIIILTRWQVGNFRRSGSIANAFRIPLMPAYAVFGLVIISYAASLPAVFKNKVETKYPQIALDRIGDDQLIISSDSQGAFVANVHVNLVIDNKPAKNLYVDTRYVDLYLTMERDDVKMDSWYSNDVTVSLRSQPISHILISKEDARIFQVSGTIDLPADTVELIKRKEAGEAGSNEYAFYLHTKLFVDSTDYDRQIAIDYSQAISGL